MLLSVCLLLCGMVQAQDFTIPAYKTKEDYGTHQANVLKTIEWLKSTPLSHPQRPQANAYLLKWAEGSPTVSITLQSYVMNLADKNPDFLMLWIGGWIEYALLQKEGYSKEEANYQAVKTVVDYYMAGHDAQKDARLEKLVKLQEKDKLKEWVAKQS